VGRFKWVVAMYEDVVTVDDKGRVLIPAEVRRRMNLRAGTRLRVSIEKGGIVLRPLVPEPTRVRLSLIHI